MKDFTIINREKHETDFLPADSVVMFETMSASDLLGYDEELLDSKDLRSYDSLIVFYLNDGTYKYYKSSCQFIMR